MKQEIHKYLKQHGVKPSVQRVAVMRYLVANKTHPTAEVIYNDLSIEMPTLSKMTVYNTLNLLAQSGAILALNVDPKQTHYDGDTSLHAHFICTDCRHIEDIAIANDSFVLANYPEGRMVIDVQLIYRGKCGNCAKKTENNS